MLAFDISGGWVWSAVVGIGTAIGLVIAYFASKEYINQTMRLLKDTIESQEQIITTKEELAKNLAEANSAVVASVEKKLEAMTTERDAYRDQLHALRNEHTPLLLELQELKLRPDLNEVLQKEEQWHKRREDFYTQMAGNQQAIMQIQRETISILALVKDTVEKDLEQSHKVCTEVRDGLNKVVAKLEERDNKQADRDSHMTSLLEALLDEFKRIFPTPATSQPPPQPA